MNHLARRPAPRAVAAVLATAALACLACLAGCGASTSSADPAGSGASAGQGGSANASLLGFSRCMRSHGVPDFPDPEPSGNAKFPSAQQLGVSDSQYQTSENACQRLLPAGADDSFPPAEVQQLLVGMREFSQCVRGHGVPDWPDPAVDSQGRPLFPLGSHGISRDQYHSAQVQTAISRCQRLLPAALGGGTPVG